MKRLLSVLFMAGLFFMAANSARAYVIPLSETDLFGPFPGSPSAALAHVSVTSSAAGTQTLTVFSNPHYLQWGAVFDELYFNVNPQWSSLQVDVDASVGGDWQLVPNGQASRFGVFGFSLLGSNLPAGQGDPLIVHLSHQDLNTADFLWDNEQGWGLAARLRNPLDQSRLYLAASTPQVVPLPSALLFMVSGVGGIGLMRRRFLAR